MNPDWIKALTSLLWLVFAATIFALFFKRIRDELLPNLTSFKAMGVEVSFVKSAMEEAIKLGKDDWQVTVSKKDRNAILSRIRKQANLFNRAKILWVDDLPKNNRHERRLLRRLHADVDIATNTADALERLEIDIYDLVISDIGRQDKNDPDGLQFLQKLRNRPDETPVVFYVGDYEPQLGVPDEAFGITDRPDQLLHLVLDVLE